MSDASIRKRKGTRTFLTSKKRRCLDRLNESGDLCHTLELDEAASTLESCPLCREKYSIGEHYMHSYSV